jgi:hypothetical protein
VSSTAPSRVSARINPAKVPAQNVEKENDQRSSDDEEERPKAVHGMEAKMKRKWVIDSEDVSDSRDDREQ